MSGALYLQTHPHAINIVCILVEWHFSKGHVPLTSCYFTKEDSV